VLIKDAFRSGGGENVVVVRRVSGRAATAGASTFMGDGTVGRTRPIVEYHLEVPDILRSSSCIMFGVGKRSPCCQGRQTAAPAANIFVLLGGVVSGIGNQI